MTNLTSIATALDLEGVEWGLQLPHKGSPIWQFTDRDGISFYCPVNSTLADVRKRYREKLQSFVKK